MKPKLILILFFIFYTFKSISQYADLGSGKLKNEIWWFDWANFNVTEGASKTFTTNDGLEVKIIFSNVGGEILTPTEMNTWSGSVLHLLYNFSNSNIKPALLKPQTPKNSNFRITISTTRNGVPTPFTFIAADAEASNSDEYIFFKTNGSNWKTIDFFKNSNQIINPLSGCGTQTAIITQTYGEAPKTGQNPVIATESSSNNLIIDVNYESYGIQGGTAVAFGLLAPIDRGDLPASYGFAHHKLNFNYSNSCNYGPPFPSLSVIETLKLGAIMGDADGSETLNDNNVGADEDAINSFPDYNGSGTYALDISCSNKSGNNAYLNGWFDYNSDGIFTSNESASTIVPSNSTIVVLTWSNLPIDFVSSNVQDFAFRLRLSSNFQSISSPFGLSNDGEVEDYYISIKAPCKFQISTMNDTSICLGGAVKLFTSGADTYRWFPSATLSSLTVADPIAKPTSATSYIVEGWNTQGCYAKDTVKVDVHSLPVVTKINDTTICEGHSIMIWARGGENYSWRPTQGTSNLSEQSIVVSPLSTTKYYVTVADKNNCSITDSIKVSIKSKTIFAIQPIDSNICFGETVTFKASGGDNYEWIASGNTLSNEPIFSFIPEKTETYSVIIKESSCSQVDTLHSRIIVNPLPKTYVTKSNDIDCSIGEAVLKAYGGVAYLWDGNIINPNKKSSTITVSPLEVTKYKVLITDDKGCSTEDSILVNVNIGASRNLYLMPNSFTPNNDGKNDCFGVKLWGPLRNFEFTIFDRWGQKVFYTKNSNECWNGRYKGIQQPAGVFVYLIRALSLCGVVEKKGVITLIR